VPTRPGRYQDFYAGIVATVVDGAAPPVEWADAVEGLRIIEAAHRSAQTGSVLVTD
jgi:scyllo-inositol 2-dehydrogenase (NADP+)